MRLQRLLANETAEWLKADRDASFLLRGARLEQFEDWAKTTTIALTAMSDRILRPASTERERQRLAEEQRRAREVKLEHRAKRVLQGLVAVAVIAAIISGALALIAANREQEAQVQRQEAVTQKQEADSQRQEAETQRQLAETQKQEALRQASIGLAAQAVAELNGASPERSVLLALEALENYPYTGQAESALAKAVDGYIPYYDLEEGAFAGNMGSGVWSPNGKQFAQA